MQVLVDGEVPQGPVAIVANHLSYMDVIALHQAGVHHVVATLAPVGTGGTGHSVRQCRGHRFAGD
jgi:hypothetical protein